jgi:hypothetical protein
MRSKTPGFTASQSATASKRDRPEIMKSKKVRCVLITLSVSDSPFRILGSSFNVEITNRF